MAPLTHYLVSTHGDFITNSASFVEVPDTSLVFESQNGSLIHLTGFVWISGCGAEVGLMVDGLLHQSVKVSSYQVAPVHVGFQMVMAAPAGVHRISVVLRTMTGEESIPEGPREWSPRKKKKSTSWAKIERASHMPLAITAIVT